MPVAGAALQTQWGGGTDIFLAKFKTGITGKGAFDYSTYVGLTGTYIPTSLALAPDGTVYLVGYGSIGLPSSANAQQGGYASGTSDGFLMVLK
jgi:hypothetical protein